MKKLAVVLVVGLLFVGFLPAFAGELTPTVPDEKRLEKKGPGSYLPEGVPNVFDPEVRVQFRRVGIVNLRGNPDFPVLIHQNIVGEQPQIMLLGLDARNGKESWSLASDPIILIVLFADQETILAAWMDAGFADSGKPSRVFRKLDDPLEDTLKGLGKGISLTYL